MHKIAIKNPNFFWGRTPQTPLDRLNYQVHSGLLPKSRFGESLGFAKCGSWSATLLKWSATRATFGKHCKSLTKVKVCNIYCTIVIENLCPHVQHCQQLGHT